jgi:hypothetical protein
MPSYKNNDNDNNKTKKVYKKAGRTILIKSASGSNIEEDLINNLENVVNKSETKSQQSVFLTFDTIENALAGFKLIKAWNKDYRVKFSYYQIYFTINGLSDNFDYNQVKSEFINHLSTKIDSNVLYFKFYKKDDKYINCGDFTIDTFEGMNLLLNKEKGNKEYTFGSYNGIFYRYNSKKTN